MEIFVNYEYRQQDVEELFDVEALVEHVVGSQDMPEPLEVSISFVTDERIHELNREFRDVDRPTDVLSFECDGAGDDFDEEEFGPDQPFELGDIFVAVDIAERQAPEYGMTFQDEMSLLITHGLLHLCGYDHLQDDEAAVMEQRERELLSAFWQRPFKRHGFED